MSYELVAQHEDKPANIPWPQAIHECRSMCGHSWMSNSSGLGHHPDSLCHRAAIIINFQIPQTKPLASWQPLSSEIGQATVLRGQLLQYTGIISEAISFHKGCINQNIISRLKCNTMYMNASTCYVMQIMVFYKTRFWFHKYTSINLKNKESIWISRHPLPSICNVVSISMDDNIIYS